MGLSRQEEQIRRIDSLPERLAAHRPYEGEMLDRLRKYYRVGPTWTSNALEGSPYTDLSRHSTTILYRCLAPRTGTG